MNKRKNPGTGAGFEVSGDDVIRIFSLRASGKTLEQIASEFPFSSSIVGQVLHRRRRADVPIPSKILEKVQEMYQPKKGNRCNTNPTLTPSPHRLLANFTAACHEVNKARAECLKVGLPEQTLDLLQDSVMDSDVGLGKAGTG